jgi:hypothetical protein
MSHKDIAEAVGLVAIVASLVFVGLQLRQTQDIAFAEGYSMQVTAWNDSASAISANVDIWRRGTAGEDLDENEATVFAILVTQVNQAAILGFLHSQQVAGMDEAKIAAQDFAGFLHRNPGARGIWVKREEILATYRKLLDSDYQTHIWTQTVDDYLAELDLHAPPIEERLSVDW